MNYNTNVIQNPSIDDVKNYSPFLYKSVQDYIEYNYDITLDDLFKQYGLGELKEQYGYSRELDGTRYDVNVKILDKLETFNFNVLNNIKESISQNCILTFINNSLTVIKLMVKEIGSHYNIEFPELIIDSNINIYFANNGTKTHEKYINININIGSSSANTQFISI